MGAPFPTPTCAPVGARAIADGAKKIRRVRGGGEKLQHTKLCGVAAAAADAAAVAAAAAPANYQPRNGDSCDTAAAVGSNELIVANDNDTTKSS